MTQSAACAHTVWREHFAIFCSFLLLILGLSPPPLLTSLTRVVSVMNDLDKGVCVLRLRSTARPGSGYRGQRILRAAARSRMDTGSMRGK